MGPPPGMTAPRRRRDGMDEYLSICWAAACLALWAGRGVSRGDLADAIGMVCAEAELTVPQETMFKRVADAMIYGEFGEGGEGGEDAE